MPPACRLLLLLAIGVTSFKPLEKDYKELYVVCKDAQTRQCFARPMQRNETYLPNILHKDLPPKFRDKFWCGISILKPIPPHRGFIAVTNWNKTSRAFCKTNKVFIGLQLPWEIPETIENRLKRETGFTPRGRYRGQTQSQYLSIDKGNGSDDGKAEALSNADSSRASVSGRSGMGQAQSQTIYDPSCDECYGHGEPGSEFLVHRPGGTGSNRPQGPEGAGGTGTYGPGGGGAGTGPYRPQGPGGGEGAGSHGPETPGGGGVGTGPYIPQRPGGGGTGTGPYGPQAPGGGGGTGPYRPEGGGAGTGPYAPGGGGVGTGPYVPGSGGPGTGPYGPGSGVPGTGPYVPGGVGAGTAPYVPGGGGPGTGPYGPGGGGAGTGPYRPGSGGSGTGPYVPGGGGAATRPYGPGGGGPGTGPYVPGGGGPGTGPHGPGGGGAGTGPYVPGGGGPGTGPYGPGGGGAGTGPYIPGGGGSGTGPYVPDGGGPGTGPYRPGGGGAGTGPYVPGGGGAGTGPYVPGGGGAGTGPYVPGGGGPGTGPYVPGGGGAGTGPYVPGGGGPGTGPYVPGGGGAGTGPYVPGGGGPGTGPYVPGGGGPGTGPYVPGGGGAGTGPYVPGGGGPGTGPYVPGGSGAGTGPYVPGGGGPGTGPYVPGGGGAGTGPYVPGGGGPGTGPYVPGGGGAGTGPYVPGGGGPGTGPYVPGGGGPGTGPYVPGGGGAGTGPYVPGGGGAGTGPYVPGGGGSGTGPYVPEGGGVGTGPYVPGGGGAGTGPYVPGGGGVGTGPYVTGGGGAGTAPNVPGGGGPGTGPYGPQGPGGAGGTGSYGPQGPGGGGATGPYIPQGPGGGGGSTGSHGPGAGGAGTGPYEPQGPGGGGSQISAGGPANSHGSQVPTGEGTGIGTYNPQTTGQVNGQWPFSGPYAWNQPGQTYFCCVVGTNGGNVNNVIGLPILSDKQPTSANEGLLNYNRENQPPQLITNNNGIKETVETNLPVTVDGQERRPIITYPSTGPGNQNTNYVGPGNENRRPDIIHSPNGSNGGTNWNGNGHQSNIYPSENQSNSGVGNMPVSTFDNRQPTGGNEGLPNYSTGNINPPSITNAGSVIPTYNPIIDPATGNIIPVRQGNGNRRPDIINSPNGNEGVAWNRNGHQTNVYPNENMGSNTYTRQNIPTGDQGSLNTNHGYGNQNSGDNGFRQNVPNIPGDSNGGTGQTNWNRPNGNTNVNGNIYPTQIGPNQPNFGEGTNVNRLNGNTVNTPILGPQFDNSVGGKPSTNDFGSTHRGNGIVNNQNVFNNNQRTPQITGESNINGNGGAGYYPTQGPQGSVNPGHNGGFLGVPSNVLDPNSIASVLDNDESEALASVNQNSNATVASASSKGGTDKSKAQTQVEGRYTGSGSFSAQAQISDENKGAESQVSGGKQGASSSAQGRGRNNKSQANVQLGSETGSLITTSQSDGSMHSSNTQVQGSVKGGMADAQARGPGSTSSQAQIGFTPYKAGNKSHEIQKAPFVGGGTATAQSSGRIGQTQSQLQGTFKYGITYNGAAQAGSSIDKDAVFPNRLPFNKIDVFDENEKNINVDAEKPIGETSLADAESNKNEEEAVKKDVSHTHADHHKTDAPQPNGERRSFQAPHGDSVEYEETTNKEDIPTDDYDPESTFGGEGPDPEAGEVEYPNYEEYPREPDSTHQSLQSSNKKGVDVKQTTRGNTQHILLGPLRGRDTEITQRSSEQKPDEAKIYQPGERVPGTGGYTIPIGFTGSVKSVASKDRTYAIGSKDSPSQAQTVAITPGTGKIKYNYPKSLHSYGRSVNPGDLRSLNIPKNNDNPYVSVSKSVTGALDGDNNIKKQYSHTYFTKSSSCGYFTFSCTIVSGTNGRTKVCKPKIPTNPDGTPMKC